MQRKDFRCTVIVNANKGNVYFHFEGANDFQSHIDDLIKYCRRQLYLFHSFHRILAVFVISSLTHTLSHRFLSIFLLFFPFSIRSRSINFLLPRTHRIFFSLLHFFLSSLRVCKNCYEKNPIHTLHVCVHVCEWKTGNHSGNRRQSIKIKLFEDWFFCFNTHVQGQNPQYLSVILVNVLIFAWNISTQGRNMSIR